MKDSSGNSLVQNTFFQNGYVDTVAREELEAQQDRIRLQKELNEEIQQAFGDGDFSDSEINNSYCASGSGNYSNSHSNNENPATVNASKGAHRHSHNKDYSDSERLKVLYDVRQRESDQLRSEIERLKKQAELEKVELTNLLKQTQNQLERMTASHDEIRTILGQTTTKLNETEYELSALKLKHSESEELKRTALHELEMCQGIIREQEKRLLIAEKNTYKSEEANFDCVLKELTSNHKKEVNSLQKTIDNLTSKLNNSEKNYARLEQQLHDEKRMHADKIATLEKCPVRYEKEIESLKKKITSLKSKNETLMLQLGNAKQEQDVLRTTLMDHVTRSDTLHKEEIDNALKELALNHQNEMESLKKEVTCLKLENEKLKQQLAGAKQEEEMLRRNLMDYVTKSDIHHQEELSELELAYSKKILTLEAQLREVQNSTRENVFKVYTEEIDRISSTFVDHFDVLNGTVEKLKNELETKMTQVTRTNETIEKLHSEIEKVNEKYVNMRKSVIALKEQLDSRTQLLHQRTSEFNETMKKIKQYLEDADTEKLNTIVMDSLNPRKNVLRSDTSKHEFAIKN